MILLPRLGPQDVATVFRELKQADATPGSARDVVKKVGCQAHWNPAGGVPAAEGQRETLASALRGLAEACGYPDPPDLAGQQRFDRRACRVLAGDAMLGEAGGDLLRADCWAGLTILDVPDLAVWRHGGSGSRLSRDRLEGGPRNFLRRLWLRIRALRVPDDGDADSWFLVDRLTEDAMVALIERPSIAADPRVAQAIASEWTERAGSQPGMEALMRAAIKRVRAAGEVRMLSVLSDDQLRSLVAEAFDHASRRLAG